MDLRPSQSNLTERETGSDSEAIVDPVGEGEKVAGPSSQPYRRIPQAPPALAPVAAAGPAPVAAAGPAPVAATGPRPAAAPGPRPAAAPAPGSLDEPGNSSSPTVRLEGSPQPAVIFRRRRRRREISASITRRHVDMVVLNYLSRIAEGEEAYCRSLAPYLRPLPREVRLRVRGSIQILIDACTPPNSPYELFEFLERWQLSPRNLLQLNPNPEVNGHYGSEAPPPRVLNQRTEYK